MFVCWRVVQWSSQPTLQSLRGLAITTTPSGPAATSGGMWAVVGIIIGSVASQAFGDKGM